MSNADRYPCLFCQTQNRAVEVMNMTVNYVIRAVDAQELPKVRGIDPGAIGMRASENLTAKSANFVIIVPWLGGMN